jgi:hypothetical protein
MKQASREHERVLIAACCGAASSLDPKVWGEGP